ncbi:LysR family transcriptional regulator [Acinetobacter populi]|uniref:HTH lysR-type domain-containing protein n=1 Tax=Acinetobacter populi TaxID=1582270 RepID=A0A1Z9YZZ9_9GAMM|nr:LysR family transcriptional regulator [Acinetobacter populi]OUY07780.1 hypothetical protein CAP51_08625 [Acinetobacter populi]
MDTIKAIQVFIEVAERESFTQAADHLNLSRAMVSRYVEYLEQRFAVRLLQRNTRKVTLTLAGEQALVHCRAMLRQQQELYALSSEQQLQGTIRLTMGQFLFDLYFKQILIQFRQQYPQIRIDLLITEEIVDLYDQRIDLAFRISQKFAEGLIAFPLKDIVSVLCASPQFLHHHSLQHPQQLIDVPCLVHQAIGRHNTWVLSAEQQPQNYTLQTAYSSNEVMTLYQLCLSGQGVAMLPSDLVSQDLQHGRLIQILTTYQAQDFELCLLYPSRLHLPKITQLFIAFVKQTFRQDD